MKRLAFAFAPFVAAAGLAGAAHAQTLTTQVEFERADLLHEEGVASIESDIRRAAHAVCPVQDRRDMTLRRLQSQCVARAIARANTQLQRHIAEAEHDSRSRLALVIDAGAASTR